MPNGNVSIKPEDFIRDDLAELARKYAIPGKDEAKSHIPVYGIPAHLGNTLAYVIPTMTSAGDWDKSVSNSTRFLLSVGLPMVEEIVKDCQYPQLMADATQKMDVYRIDQLKRMLLRLDMDSFQLSGGRDVTQGGFKVYCLLSDLARVGGVKSRLGAVSQGTIVTAALLAALSRDTTCTFISAKLAASFTTAWEKFRGDVLTWNINITSLKS